MPMMPSDVSCLCGCNRYLVQTARGVVVAAADRPIWYPGNDEVVPDYLDGTLAGEY